MFGLTLKHSSDIVVWCVIICPWALVYFRLNLYVSHSVNERKTDVEDKHCKSKADLCIFFTYFRDIGVSCHGCQLLS